MSGVKERSATFNLDEGEQINRVNTEYGSNGGSLCKLEVMTSTGRRWAQKVGNGKGHSACMAGTLAYVSSTYYQGDNGYYQYVFHWQ